jgi:hypothetical protein
MEIRVRRIARGVIIRIFIWNQYVIENMNSAALRELVSGQGLC